jgi:hypothetical protein
VDLCPAGLLAVNALGWTQRIRADMITGPAKVSQAE